MCRIHCGGTREAGDGNFTMCHRRGYKLTVCGMRYKVIEPIWVMSAEEREEKLRNGMTFDALVLHNKMLKEIAEGGDLGRWCTIQ